MVLVDAAPNTDPRQVTTPINPTKTLTILSYLHIIDNWSHIIEGLINGFDIGLRTLPTTTLIFPNHNSSNIDQEFIRSYIEAEQAAGRYSQPFQPSQLELLIGPFRTSPIGIVPKPGSSKLRMIQDLSYPRNNPTIPSVNSLINADDFPTAWGSFDATTAMILTLPPGCLAATFDISSAYRLTPIRPDQQNWTCVAWDNQVWVDRAVMFGMASSAGVFGAVADMLVAIYGAAGFGPICKWVDDFFVVRLPHQQWSEMEFINLTADIGVPWSLPKLRPLASTQRYIGFDWHLDTKMVSFPVEKREKLEALVDSWLPLEAKFTCKETSSLHGKLVHASCIYPLIRPFLTPIATFAAQFTSPRAHLSPPSAVRSSLTTINRLLPLFPAQLPLHPPALIDVGWWGDASTSFGIGVVVGNHWANWKWAPGVKVGPKQQYDIGWAEAVAVELGLLMLLTLGQAGPGLFLVRSDNEGVVMALNKGRSRSISTNEALQRMHTTLAIQGMRLRAIYVTSQDNIADPLSRGDISAFRQRCPTISSHLHLPPPLHLSHLLHL